MTYREAVRDFKKAFSFLWEFHEDYWTAQEAWSAYTDSLCKDGQITKKQFNTWRTPFPYGIRLGVSTVMYKYTKRRIQYGLDRNSSNTL